MDFGRSMQVAKRQLVDGATLNELREAVNDLRALNPNSALANLVDAQIAEIERPSAPEGDYDPEYGGA